MSRLKRYTDIASLLDIIDTSSITMLNPASWIDQNDRYAMECYRQHRNVNTLLAICFTEAKETFHHWNVFAAGSNGVCIEFDKNLLIESITKTPGVRHGPIQYIINDEQLKPLPDINELPFLKRTGYHDEMEYRFIYEDDEPLPYMPVPIDLRSIKEITFSPNIPKNLYHTLCRIIIELPGLKQHQLTLDRSMLVNDCVWKCLVDTIVEPDTEWHDHLLKHL